MKNSVSIFQRALELLSSQLHALLITILYKQNH